MWLLQLSRATIMQRPSASCKTPYVADLFLQDTHTPHLGSVLGHCPALGCNGLSDKGAEVFVTPMIPGKAKCQYRVDLAIHRDTPDSVPIIVGINPKLAEQVMYYYLRENICPFVRVASFQREQSLLNSRFDFIGKDSNGRTFVIEIKNVPLADAFNVSKKERKKLNGSSSPSSCSSQEKIAYFPDGYRKHSTDVVSPRALKHIMELEQIATTTDFRAILCFVVQRPDATRFEPSNSDLTYKEAVQCAWKNGVEIYAVQVEWTEAGQCLYKGLLPVVLFDTYGPSPKP